MDKHKALTILQNIHQDMYGEWRIPHHYKPCEKEIILANGEKTTLVAEDEVHDFIAYVKKLIENDEVTRR